MAEEESDRLAQGDDEPNNRNKQSLNGPSLVKTRG
jgi:hypothetical protein